MSLSNGPGSVAAYHPGLSSPGHGFKFRPGRSIFLIHFDNFTLSYNFLSKSLVDELLIKSLGGESLILNLKL